MKQEHLTIRELQMDDIEPIVRYWTESSDAHMLGMGVDLAKLPEANAFRKMLAYQLQLPIEQRRAYCLIWECNGQAVGHSNTNPTHFGDYAYMHLHLWDSPSRKRGWGTTFVRLGLPYFFKNLKLDTLYCHPYALNPAPNKTLEKVGFSFVKRYTTIPGSINFEQEVIQWKMTRKRFEELYPSGD